MPALRNAIPSVKLTVWLPEDLHAKCAVSLFSTVENRIPKSAWKEFFSRLLRDYFTSRTLDLAPYIINAEPGIFIIRGSVDTIEMLKERLSK